MANLIRSAKSGSDWTPHELQAYNVVIQVQDACTFFEVDQLPEPNVDQELLTVQEASDMADPGNFDLINTLDLKMAYPESSVIVFIIELFKRLGYATRPRIVQAYRDLNFMIRGEWKQVQTDACILNKDQKNILLVVHEDKRFHGKPLDLAPQLIAEAIAAFDCNNRIREKERGLPALEQKIMPGIVIIGTTPIFYKIPVTSALLHHVQFGTYPLETTVVTAHAPLDGQYGQPNTECMKPLNNRRTILSCYEAFKGVIGI